MTFADMVLIGAEMVRARFELWRNISSAWALPMALVPGFVPYQSADTTRDVTGNGFVFRDACDNDSCVMLPDGAHRPHAYTGVSCEAFLCPEGSHQPFYND